MKACIYARSSRRDKSHRAVSIERQIEDARALAHKHGLTVAYEHVFTDADSEGHAPPACWTADATTGRPALAALIGAVENAEVQRVIVRRMDRLGTDHGTLSALLTLFDQYDINIIAEPEPDLDENPTERFAVSLLQSRIQYDTDAERERKHKLRARKIEEIERLRDKIGRLEAEVAELAESVRTPAA
jgi:DNA invertase Pin-like site-specific DNA recombinase